MMKFQKCKISIFWYAFFIVSVGSLFTYFIHRPSIGIDDANITQVYAKNIADGFGYVYNIGSERVEGSTSLVWTVVNLIFFVFFENSEKYITAFCFVLAVLTVREALILLGYLTYKFKINYFISAFLLGSFLVSYPSFFTWTIWALMDVTIWTFLFTVIVCRFCSLLISENIISIKKTSVFLLCFALAILPLVRPEGLVVSVGFTLLFLAFAHVNNLVLLRKALMISLGGSILLLATFTIWRLQYFGFPVPNTFYAKVSLDYFNQVISGTKYLVKYLVEPIIAVQILFSFGLIGYTYARFWQSFQYTNWLAIVWLSAFAGIFALYITLGGDHFSSARQFQVLTPLLSTLASVGVANIICRITENIEPQKLNFGRP
jgi:arabinofuranosyltransferase